MSTSTSRKPHHHTRTPSFSTLSTFSSPPSSPETTLLPLSLRSSPPSSPPRTSASSPTHFDHLPALLRTSTVVRWNLFARGVGTKSIKALKKKDIPLLLVFIGCCFVYFHALAGQGYQEPEGRLVLSDLAAARPGPDFQIELPLLVEEPVGPSQKELEEVWKTMRRGAKDGAWLLKTRDKRAVRRNELTPPPVAPRAVEPAVVGEVETAEVSSESLVSQAAEELSPEKEEDDEEMDDFERAQRAKKPFVESLFDNNGFIEEDTIEDTTSTAESGSDAV